MKKSMLILFGLLISICGFAQTPQGMSYQAVIRDASSELITNQTVGLRISVLQGSESGTAVYQETHSPTTNSNGLISLVIGNGSIISGDFESIDWANGPYFIKTETDINGGSNYTISGTSQMLSVPYALHAQTAGNVKTYNIGDFAQGGIVFWVDETGQHGLVCAKNDQDGGSGIRWFAGTHGVTRATGDSPFSGKANTSIIISSQISIGDDGSDYAAQLCNDLQVIEGGKTYGDWYLPSKEELNLMYQNKVTIDITAGMNGGTAFASSTYYWSSTEFNNGIAWLQYFSNGNQYYIDKGFSCRVRAVRAF